MRHISHKAFFAATLVVAFWSSLFAAPPTTSPVAVEPAAGSRTDIRILQVQVSSLQQKLAEANALNTRLQQENAALRRRLGMPPLFPAPAPVQPAQVSVVLPGEAVDSMLFIELPAVNWGSSDAMGKKELISHIPGASIKLKPFSSTLQVKQVNSSHLALQINKTSKALGDEGTTTDVGSLFVQSGSLYLQWAAGNQSEALDALKYASLEVREQPDAQPKIYSMVHAEDASVTLNQPSPVKLSLPMAVAAKAKMALEKSSEWQSTTEADGTLKIEQNGLEVEIKLDQSGGVTASYADIDPDHAQRRLNAMNAKSTKAQARLAELQAQAAIPPKMITADRWDGVMHYPAVMEDRTALTEQIQSASEELAGLDKAIPKLQAEVDGINAKNAAIGRLDGTVVVLNLPNGVHAARITLHVGK